MYTQHAVRYELVLATYMARGTMMLMMRNCIEKTSPKPDAAMAFFERDTITAELLLAKNPKLMPTKCKLDSMIGQSAEGLSS